MLALKPGLPTSAPRPACRIDQWLKVKNPAAPAARRQAEENSGKGYGGGRRR